MKKKYKFKILLLQILFIAILILTFKYALSIFAHKQNKNVNTYDNPNIETVSTNQSNSSNDVSDTNIKGKTSANIKAGNMILVNKSHVLSKDYVPSDLVKVKVNFNSSSTSEEKMMRKDAAAALESMFKGAANSNVKLYGLNGYRSYSTQNSLYNSACKEHGKNYANRQVALPGASEHQTGLAMDITNKNYSTSFETTIEGKWIAKNAYKYGFILRFPYGKESKTGYNYEPWHVRYVGKKAAKDIYTRKIVLEEYLNE